MSYKFNKQIMGFKGGIDALEAKETRGTSPGRGFDRQGNLIGAAKTAHEAKMQREVKNKIKSSNSTLYFTGQAIPLEALNEGRAILFQCPIFGFDENKSISCLFHCSSNASF